MDDNDFLTKEQNPAQGALVGGLGLIVAGGVVLGMGFGAFEKMDNMNALGAAAAASGDGGIQLSINALHGGIFCGGVLIVAGILGIVANFVKSRTLGAVVVALGLLSGGAMVAASVLYSGLVTDLEALIELNGFQADVLTAQQQVLNDMYSAIHNGCCVKEYKENPSSLIDPCTKNALQDPVGSCEDTSIAQCENSIPTQAQIIGQDNFQFLCTCYLESYDKIAAHVASEGTCEILKNAKVTITPEVQIPKTGLGLNSALNQAPEYESYLDITEMPLVGNPAPRVDFSLGSNVKSDACVSEFYGGVAPSEFTNPTGTEQSFGCGLGYMKGVAWIMGLYAAQSLATTGLLVGGSLAILISLGLVALWIMSSGNKNEDWLDVEPAEQHQIAAKSDF